MMEALGALVENYGLSGLFIFIVLAVVMLIITGKLVPKRTMDDRVKDKTDIIVVQQDAIDKFGPILNEIKETQREQLEYAKTTDHALHSIQNEGAKQ